MTLVGATLAEKREAIVQMARDAVQQARTYTDDVEFSAEDAGRTDRGFLREIVRAAIEAGATTVNIPDTTGYCTPDEYAALFETVRESLDNPGGVTFSTHCHDDLGLATANSLAGVRAGARQIECTINGIGERAGNAAYEEVVMAAESLYNVDTGIDTTRITELARIVERMSGIETPANKPIVGANAFSHESGIHAAGVIENSDTFEPGVMTPEMVGAERELVLGKHTGQHSVRERLVEAGYRPTDDEVRKCTRRVKDFGAEKERVTMDVLRRFAGEVGIDRSERIARTEADD